MDNGCGFQYRWWFYCTVKKELHQLKYILVTGASSGLGRQIAISLSKTCNIMLGGRNQKRLEETQSSCENNTLIWDYDLSNLQDIEKDLEKQIKEHALEIEAFVHCAGVMKMLPLRALSVDALNDILAVNVVSPAMITKTVTVRKINSKNLKSVVFISSNISNRGAVAFSAYGASKAALDGLMRNLAVELAPNVRVNSILPGGMITEMTKDIFDDEVKKAGFEKNYPLGIGTPQDIAPMVEFLLSEDSRWITGQQFTVDGGRTIDITERNK